MEEYCVPCSELQSKLSSCDCENENIIFERNFITKEHEVRNLQLELCNMQHERAQLVQQRKLLDCTNPSLSFERNLNLTKHLSSMSIPCNSQENSKSTPNAVSKQLRDLREQYTRLQEDYKTKICEVSCLRTEMEKLKYELKDKKQLECNLVNLEKKLRSFEAERDNVYGNKEQQIEQEQAFIVTKHRFREAQDELEEMRSNMQDQICQTDEYRKKYLQAQQTVEELKRQLDLMEMDNARINENVTLEICKIKGQFQEKLSELAPLPEILKDTQLKLQESQRIQLILERNCKELQREIVTLNDKLQATLSQIEIVQNENIELQNQIGKCNELKQEIIQLKSENEELKKSASTAEEAEEQLRKTIDEKLHEIAQLSAMIEQIREDSARQVVRSKERSEAIRNNLQTQISELEKELAQSKAITRSAKKDRDEIRQKIQNQLIILNDSFAQAQGRINLLQGHVNYLKDDNAFSSQNHDDLMASNEPLISTRGFDSCNCEQ